MYPSTTFNLLNQTYLDTIIQPAKGKNERGVIIRIDPGLIKKFYFNCNK